MKLEKIKKLSKLLLPYALILLAMNSDYFIKDVIIQIIFNCSLIIIVIILTIKEIKWLFHITSIEQGVRNDMTNSDSKMRKIRQIAFIPLVGPYTAATILYFNRYKLEKYSEKRFNLLLILLAIVLAVVNMIRLWLLQIYNLLWLINGSTFIISSILWFFWFTVSAKDVTFKKIE